jgi:hypothetical protein
LSFPIGAHRRHLRQKIFTISLRLRVSVRCGRSPDRATCADRRSQVNESCTKRFQRDQWETFGPHGCGVGPRP